MRAADAWSLPGSDSDGDKARLVFEGAAKALAGPLCVGDDCTVAGGRPMQTLRNIFFSTPEAKVHIDGRETERLVKHCALS